MKKTLLSLLLIAPLSAQVIATERVIDGLCELYDQQYNARSRSEARSINKRIYDYKARFGLQEMDERDCAVGVYGGNRYNDRYYDRRIRDYEDGYIGGYYNGYRDNGYYERGRDRTPTPQDPWD